MKSQVAVSRWVAGAVRLCIGIVTVLCVYFIVNAGEKISFSSLVVHPAAAISGIFATFIVLAIRALRWKVLFNSLGGRMRLTDLPAVYGAAFFLGIVSPGRIGEVSRIWYSRKLISSLPASACSVILDRILDAVPTVFIAGAFLIGVRSLDVSDLGLYVLIIAMGVAVSLALVFLYPERLFRLVDRGSRRLVSRVTGKESSENPRSFALCRSSIWKSLALSALSHVFLVVQAYLFAVAVGAEANAMIIYGVVSLATFVAALPLSVGGVGTREAAVIVALQSVGFSQTQGVAFSVLTLCNFLSLLAVSACLFALQPMRGASPASDSLDPQYPAKPDRTLGTL